MGLLDTQILSLNKSRLRAVYWRQDSEGGWVKTLPLPADPASINHYLLKGFKANPPEKVNPSEIVQDGLLQCPVCEFRAKDVFGLQSHLRKHINKSKKEEEE